MLSTHRNQFVILFVLFCCDFVLSQGGQGCSQSSCGKCLQNPGCVWCENPKFTLENRAYSRCGTMESQRSTCGGNIVTLEPAAATPERNRVPQTIDPKSYTIKLGVGQTARIEMEYTDPGNRPLDLYYLMDLSYTMHDDKDAVITLGKQLAGALKLTTKDVKMGFGSFIDKPMLPYATIQQINQPETDKITKPYGFRNHLKLTTDHKAFERVVNDAKISANLDAPEGGLDAIMQAIVCQEEIGWRKEAWRMLVLSTDGNFHIAGDGKLGGIVTPNDARCHMKDNMYTHSTILDYPSISQIISKVQEEKIFVIFAVVESERALYEELARHLQPFASTIILNQKSENVDKLVREQYERIRTTVELILLLNNVITMDNTKPFPFLELSYSVKCNSSTPFAPGYKCEGVGSEAKLKFNIDAKLLICPERKEHWKTHFDISTGSTETLRVYLELNCGCQCEKETTRIGREICDQHGQIRCGICSCDEGFVGDYCNCLKNATGSQNFNTDDDSKCKKPGDSRACSGQGNCNCGQCTCKDGLKGDFCDCNPKECPQNNYGIECSGKGVCRCQDCACDPGFKGRACECQDSEENCKRPGDDKLCSGLPGLHCKCNKCECQTTATGRSGKYCHVCLHNDNCDCLKEVEDFVKCSVVELNSTHVQKLNDTQHCRDSAIKTIDPELQDLQASLDPIRNGLDKRCKIPFETRRRKDCQLEYKYSYKDGNDKTYVTVKSELVCPPIAAPLNPVPIILGTIFSILLIGILTLLLWKIITFMHDKREYSRFEQERKGAKWDSSGNPLYKEATSTFKNPAYSE